MALQKSQVENENNFTNFFKTLLKENITTKQYKNTALIIKNVSITKIYVTLN